MQAQDVVSFLVHLSESMAGPSNPPPLCMSSTSLEEFNQSIPPTGSPSDDKPTSRNYHKCPRCRRDRKSCLRDSTNPIQQCDRCKRLGHQCGPFLKASRRRRVSAVSENMNILSDLNSISQTPTPAAENIQSSDRTPTTWKLGSGFDFGYPSYALAVNAAFQRLLERARLDLETCMTFEKVAAPTSILWAQSQQSCQELHACLSRQLARLQSNQLYGVNFRPIPSSTEVVQSVDETSGDFIALLCIANVLKQFQPIGLQNQGHIRNSVDELPQSYYLSTEAALKELATSMSQDAHDQWLAPHHQSTSIISDRGPFPAPHLAYLNLDAENAYQLWLNTMSEGTIVDVLGRTFPHLVAEAGDSKLLDRMTARVLKDAGRDARGMSLLDLGVIGDSALIVRTVIEKNIVLPPFTRAMQKAIIGRRPDIAEYILPHLRSTPWVDGYELNILAGLAGQSGMLKLQGQLDAVVLVEPGPQDALDSLDDLGLQLSSDEPVIPGSASFDSSDAPDWPLLPDLSSSQDTFEDFGCSLSQSSQADPAGGANNLSYWQQLYPPS